MIQGSVAQGMDQMGQIAKDPARVLHHLAGERFAPELGGQARHRIAGQQCAVLGRRRLQPQRAVAPLPARGSERGHPPGDAVAQRGTAGQQDQAAARQIARGDQEIGKGELPVAMGGQRIQPIQYDDQPCGPIGLHERGEELAKLPPQAVGGLVLALDFLNARRELLPRLIGQKHDEGSVVGPLPWKNVIEQRGHAALA